MSKKKSTRSKSARATKQSRSHQGRSTAGKDLPVVPTSAASKERKIEEEVAKVKASRKKVDPNAPVFVGGGKRRRRWSMPEYDEMDPGAISKRAVGFMIAFVLSFLVMGIGSNAILFHRKGGSAIAALVEIAIGLIFAVFFGIKLYRQLRDDEVEKRAYQRQIEQAEKRARRQNK